MASLKGIVEFLDGELRIHELPDYPGAINGLQVQNDDRVFHVAAAVDASTTAVHRAVERGADLLLVHHGLFWEGARPLVGTMYEKISLVMAHNLAIYSAHIPLDMHPRWGNNVLLARELGLEPTGGFAPLQGVAVGVRGESNLETETLRARAERFSSARGGHLVCTPLRPGQVTRRWGMCTGAGASTQTLREAAATGIDTLIVGEGPHHTAVAAVEMGITVLYLGHYATETLGVIALAEELGRRFEIETSFVETPSGL